MIRIASLIVLIFLPYFSIGQKYFVRKINVSNELVDITATAVTQDEKGFIYLGTRNGIYKYDGVTFKLVDSFNKNISALFYQNDQIYIGCEDGTLAILNRNKISLKKTKGITIKSEISKIESGTNENEILIATKGEGLYFLNNENIRAINEKNHLSDNFVYGFQQNKNTIWVATDRGLNKVKNNAEKVNIQYCNIANGLPDNIISAIKFSPNKSKILLGFQNGGIAILDTNKLYPEAIYSKNNWQQINDVLYENDQKIWLATQSGKLIQVSYANNKLNITDSILFDKPISKITKDIVGNIWILGRNELLEIVAPNISAYRLNNPEFSINNLSAVVNKFDSIVYYAIQHKIYAYHFLKNEVRTIYTSKNIITKLLKSNDELLIGTLNDGLWKMNTREKEIQKINIPNLPSNAHILDIATDPNNLWIASLEGLYHCTKDPQNTERILDVQKFNKKDGLGSDYVYQIFIDSRKRVWLATDGAGAAYYENGKLHSWKNSISTLNNKVIYSIDESADGKIWMTTLDNGLYSFNETKWMHYDNNFGLPKKEFLGIGTQPNWHLIALQQDAIFEYLPQHNFFRKYNKQSGVNIDSLSANINLLAKNENGDILFPNQNGFIIFKSSALEDKQISQIRILKIQEFLKDIPFGKKEFDNDENQISFEFEHTNFTNTEKLYFRYRLLGLNEQWIATTDKKITYSKLSPGSYTFEVQVSHNVNFEGAQSDSYTFSIAKAFYQQWWFYLAIIALLGYFVWLYIRFREVEIRNVEGIQKERLHFEYEQLKSQVNPHFLFNSLNTLVDLIDENTDRATDYTIHLAAMYRTLLSFRDKELITIKEELDLLEHYTFVQKCRFGTALHIQIDIEDFRAQKKKIVPLALQLLVENAIKHNEVSRAHPLVINISEDGYYLIVENKLKPKISEEKGEGFGISNLQKRYELLAQTEIVILKENEFFIVKLPLL